MGLLSKFWNWLTGHDEKEEDVVANYDKVAEVTSAIQTIAHTQVPNAKDAVYEAFNRLNSVKGLSEYVGTIEVSNYDTVFEQISKTVEEISSQVDSKAEAIKKYSDSNFFEKVGSTFCMGVCKIGEGLLSVVEDLGDGVVSIVGWGAGKLGFKDFQNDCANFVKKEWSHDAFNFYYKSDFAKASVFTEDSGMAGCLKLAGKAVGYLYAGGAISGAVGATGFASTKVATVAGHIASSSTWGATAAGFLGGLGAGTETGLNAGMSYDDAFSAGTKTGLVQGGLAFAGGKLGEGLGKSHAVKEAVKSGDDAAIQAAKATKWTDYQGYTDAVTKAGQRFGEASVKTIKAGTNSLVKGAAASKAMKAGAADAATKVDAANAAKANFKDELSNLKSENPFSQGGRTIKAGYDKVTTGVKDTVATVKEKGLGTTIKDSVGTKVESVKNGFSSAKEGIKEGAASAKTAVKDGTKGFINNVKDEGLLHATKDAAVNGLKTTGSTLKNVAVSGATKLGNTITSVNPAVPGVVSVAAGSTLNNSLQSSVNSINPAEKELIKTVTETEKAYNNMYQGPTVTEAPVVAPVDGAVQQTVSGGSSNGGSTGGYSGGYSGNYSGGGSTITPSTIATTAPVTIPTSPTSPPTTVPKTVPSTTTPPTTAAPTSRPTTPSSQPSSYNIVTPGVVTPSSGGGGGNSGETHSGVSFNGTSMAADAAASDELISADALDMLDELDDVSIDDIDTSTSVRKIPTFDKEIKTASKNKSSNSVIPIAAGLSVAAAAGLGAKAYMDYKRNNETSEDEEEYDDEFEDYSDENYDEGFDTPEWTGDEDTVEVDYDQPTIEDAYMQEDNFSADEDSGYTARNASELADIQ